MRIYEVKKYGKAIGFARSFDQAKVVVREDDPNAKKNCSYDQVTEYTNGVEIFAIDFKPDNEGIINKLNSLLEEKPSQPEQVEQEQQILAVVEVVAVMITLQLLEDQVELVDQELLS